MADIRTSVHRLGDHGQSVWVDHFSRSFLERGELRALIRDGVRGVTFNATTLRAGIADSDAYDLQVRQLLLEVAGTKELFLELICPDFRAACDEMRDVWVQGGGSDGCVSLDLDPHSAYDAEAMIAEAAHLHAMIARPNLLVSIPATKPGVLAVEETIAMGIPVNVTQLCSLERHRAVVEAYMRGLRRLQQTGGDLRHVASVASFPVSRVDAEADRRLHELGGHGGPRGTLAIANAKLAYQNYKSLFAGEPWNRLLQAGATAQRCVWAADPGLHDVSYVEALIGPDTVSAMSRETVAAFLDHGQVAATLEEDIDGAWRRLDALEQAGVDYADIADTVEREGVARCISAFDQLFVEIERKREAMLAGRL
jgi:transaldolase